MQPIMFAIDSITPKPGTAAAVSSWAMLRRKSPPTAPIAPASAYEFFATTRIPQAQAGVEEFRVAEQRAIDLPVPVPERFSGQLPHPPR